jgi:LmbE family N-acetylglucosaminyl deacetylase
MNVLVLAPHPDDETLGCGGVIALHVARGDDVRVVFLTSGELGLKHLAREEAWRVREAEAAEAAEVLGVRSLTFLRQRDWFLSEDGEASAAALRPILQQQRPLQLYLPHEREWHPDHRACLGIVRAALAGSDAPSPRLLAYEVWTPLEKYEHVEDITGTMACKLRAVRCYRSQLAGFRYDRAVRGLNQFRGALAAHTRYAEVFQGQAIDS